MLDWLCGKFFFPFFLTTHGKLPHSTCDAIHPLPQQHGLYHCYPPQKWDPVCSGNSASTMGESAVNIFSINSIPPHKQMIRSGSRERETMENSPAIIKTIGYTWMRNKYKKSTLSWPPTSHTVKLMFLYSTVSTLKPADDCHIVKFKVKITILIMNPRNISIYL